MKNLKSELLTGINKYGVEHVDLAIDISNNRVYGTYCSTNDSFPITRGYDLQEKDAIKLCNDFNIGYFEV